MVLKTAIGTHLTLDLQDVAWYMSQVHFKTPQVKSSFSQRDHFEYSQIAVQQHVQEEEEEEALVSGDYWQVDGLRRELIRHHKDKRMNLHKMNRSETTPIPKDQLLLLDGRETHMEFQKSKKKVLHKDNWRSERKRFADKMEEFWKGKTIYKIKEDYVILEDAVKSDLDRAKPFCGNIDDMFHPESAFSEPSGVQKKPSSQKREVGKQISRGPSLKKIEVGPPAAKRHVGKQKPKLVDDSQGGSSRKKVVVSYPKQQGDGDELDEIAKELGLEPDEPQVIESKSSAPARARGQQDSESQIEKLGSEALEPRRVSVPLPGGEAQAMAPAFKKMLRKLEDSVEPYKLHVKHYHMTQFRRRTSMLGLPDSAYEKYEDMCNKCVEYFHRTTAKSQGFRHTSNELWRCFLC